MMLRWLAGLSALLAATGAMAQPVDDLERDDATVASIAWRLQTANAPFCMRRAMLTGVQIQDAGDYTDPAAVHAAYGLAGDVYVGAVAQGSPGAIAGIAVNTTIARINDTDIATLPPPHDRFVRARQLQALLDARPDAVLTAPDGRQWRLTGVPACQVRVLVDDDRNYAEATRDEVHIGRRHLAETNGEEGIAAAMIAHEMAHSVLDHETEVVGSHHAIEVVRRTEREADRLSVWLLANAGYDPAEALEFQRTVVARHGGFLTVDATHGGWRERSRVIAAEIAALNAAPDHDWRAHFVREPR